MPIGTPLRQRRWVSGYFHHGLYRRRFTNGIALANPGSHSVTFRLGGRYKGVHGNVMTSVTLAAVPVGIVLVRA